MIRAAVILLLLTVSTGMIRAAGPEAPVLVAAASNLSHALEEIIGTYQAKSGVRVRVSYGSSGNLTHQILQGAPFHLFLPADQKSLALLQKESHPIPASAIMARGRIGFFIPHDSSLAGRDMKFILHALQNGRYRRLAMANPDYAPYGVAAQEALQKAGVWVLEEDKLLLGESAAQAMQFTLSGGVDLGVIPASYAGLSEITGKGEFLPIPEEWHQPLFQFRLLLADTPEARRFYDFLGSDEAHTVLRQHGYATGHLQQ